MEDRKELAELIKQTKGYSKDRVYCILDYVSASGMQRVIKFYLIINNRPQWIDGAIHKILGYKHSKNHDGLVVRGCGMDMGFSVVNALSCALYCPLKYEHDKAYKLQHQWI